MSLYNEISFTKFVNSLPGVTRVDQWESHVAKVGGKVFVLLNTNKEGKSSFSFKVNETSFQMMTSQNGVGQAPYFAKGKWVAVSEQANFSVADLRAYIAQSHKLVAAGLTKKLRNELGIPIDG
ncbi:MAG: MmcQ/YjbR family DNA-binding protein [Alphaproteobacteria bacterium]